MVRTCTTMVRILRTMHEITEFFVLSVFLSQNSKRSSRKKLRSSSSWIQRKRQKRRVAAFHIINSGVSFVAGGERNNRQRTGRVVASGKMLLLISIVPAINRGLLFSLPLFAALSLSLSLSLSLLVSHSASSLPFSFHANVRTFVRSFVRFSRIGNMLAL